ncbi:hypothetical protein [Lelliottia amnigena]
MTSSNKPTLDELSNIFYREFSRYEYCLKAVGLRHEKGDAKANWDLYAKDVEHVISSATDPELCAAIDYFFSHPPKKQIVKDGSLAWDDSPLQEKNKSIAIFILIRRVRNNLFHGGKFNGQWFEPERSELLLQYALTILKTCANNHANVSKAYEGMSIGC